MVKILLAAILLVTSLIASAQSDSTRYKRTNKIVSIVDIKDIGRDRTNYINNQFEGHWGGVLVGIATNFNSDYSGYSTADKGFMDMEVPQSFSVYIQPLEFNFGLQRYRNTIGLVSGVGIEFQNYRLNKKLTIEKGSNNKITPVYLLGYTENIKSKLAFTYINVPLLLEFQIPLNHRRNRLFFSAGVVGKFRVHTHSKIKYEKANGKKESKKGYGNFYFNEIQTCYHLRMGYRFVQLFAEVNAYSMFKSNKGPDVRPVTLGISLMSW